MSSSGGYVAVPRCPVTFDGTNYAEFVAFMRIHMRGIRLWGVLSGEVPCPPTPVAPVAPTPPTLPVLTADASEADKSSVDDVARLLMIVRCRTILMLLLPIVMIWLLILSGVMMTLVLRRSHC